MKTTTREDKESNRVVKEPRVAKESKGSKVNKEVRVLSKADKEQQSPKSQPFIASMRLPDTALIKFQSVLQIIAVAEGSTSAANRARN